jgi:hypothetical protein
MSNDRITYNRKRSVLRRKSVTVNCHFIAHIHRRMNSLHTQCEFHFEQGEQIEEKI